jgi:outer membrane immunogenic protein
VTLDRPDTTRRLVFVYEQRKLPRALSPECFETMSSRGPWRGLEVAVLSRFSRTRIQAVVELAVDVAFLLQQRIGNSILLSRQVLLAAHARALCREEHFMNKLLLGTAMSLILVGGASAADLPIYTKAPPAWSWTGCYIGGHVGYGWGRESFTDNNNAALLRFAGTGNSVVDNTRGPLGGGQVGCNYQLAKNWLIGVEGDFSAANIMGTATDPFFSAKAGPIGADTTWLATATGRVGYVWDRWLVYGKGGAAWAHNKYDLMPGVQDFFAAETRSGWTVGGGIEWALMPKWSAKVEFDYYDFGTRTGVQLTDKFGNIVNADIRPQIEAVKLGINYRF